MFRGSRRISDDLFFITLVVLAVLKTALARFFVLGQANPLPAFLLETALIVVVLGLVDLIPSRRRYLLTLGAYSVISAAPAHDDRLRELLRAALRPAHDGRRRAARHRGRRGGQRCSSRSTCSSSSTSPSLPGGRSPLGAPTSSAWRPSRPRPRPSRQATGCPSAPCSTTGPPGRSVWVAGAVLVSLLVLRRTDRPRASAVQ